MSKIVFNAEIETVLKPIELVTLKSQEQFISIWPGDKITAHLKSGHVCTGIVGWSIEPWCISVQYAKNESIRFDVNNIKSIELLEYSELRPETDRLGEVKTDE